MEMEMSNPFRLKRDFFWMTFKSVFNYTESLQQKSQQNSRIPKYFRHTITYGISHLFCISFHCLALLCVQPSVSYLKYPYTL